MWQKIRYIKILLDDLSWHTAWQAAFGTVVPKQFFRTKSIKFNLNTSSYNVFCRSHATSAKQVFFRPQPSIVAYSCCRSRRRDFKPPPLPREIWPKTWTANLYEVCASPRLPCCEIQSWRPFQAGVGLELWQWFTVDVFSWWFGNPMAAKNTSIQFSQWQPAGNQRVSVVCKARL